MQNHVSRINTSTKTKNVTEWDFSNDKTHARRGFYVSAGCKGQLSNFFVEDMKATDEFLIQFAP